MSVLDYHHLPTRDVRVIDWDVEPFRVALTAPSVLKQRLPLYVGTEEFAPRDRLVWHNLREQREGPGLGALVTKDLILFGRGILIKDGTVLTNEELMPRYAKNVFRIDEEPTAELGRYSHLPLREVADPRIVVTGFSDHIYGHFLIELMLRIASYQAYIAPHVGRGAKFVLSNQTPHWLRRILEENFAIGAEQIETFDPARERLMIRRAIVPELPHSTTLDGFDPGYEALIRGIAGKVSGTSMGLEKIFVSRLLFPHRPGRWRCVNELDVLRTAANAGFTPVFTEAMTWAQQISLFRGARVMVGEYGSGLHNSMFLPSGGIVAAIGVANAAQSRIDTLVGNHNAYFDVDVSGDFEVDLARFSEFLSRLP